MKHTLHLPIAALALALTSALVPGCVDSSTPDDTPAPSDATPDSAVDFAPAERVDPAEWRDKIADSDPAVRAAAADAVPGAPGSDGAPRLEDLVRTDPNPRVRERALFSYGALQGRSGVPFLKTIALSDADPNVGAAARAEIHRIRLESNEPVRGFMKVHFPEKFTLGEPFDVDVSFGASEEVPEVHFDTRLPRGVEVVSEGGASYHGKLAAKDRTDLRLTLVAREEVKGSLRLRVKLDYPEMLDVEVHQKKIGLVAQGGTGTLTEIATEVPVTR